MMESELIKRIDALIDEDRAGLAADVIRLVNIKSVREAPQEGAPFGLGAKKTLDTALAMGADMGFAIRDYGVGVGSVTYGEGEPELGIWAHGDVVPEGDGWSFAPYDAVEYKGCIIGRGATDNKGQLVCILRLFAIFKKLGVRFRYTPALYIGSNEETGMEDVVAFLEKYKPPRLSLVPDGGFPVGYGGKGKVFIKLTAKKPLQSLTIEAGHPDSPGRAVAQLSAKECPELPKCTVERGEKITVTAEVPPKHSAHPDPEGNMITVLTAALLQSGAVAEEDRQTLDFLRRTSLDVEGRVSGIYVEPQSMGGIALAAFEVSCENGRPSVGINIRYPVEISCAQIRESMAKTAAENGFEISVIKEGVAPYLNSKDSEVVRVLGEASDEVIGTPGKPFTLGGGTYAHRLPNAYVYGMNGNLPPEDFPKGKGGAHGIDECVSLDRLQRAMRIYARAMLKLNETEW